MEKEISVVEWLYGKWSEQGTLYLEDLEQAKAMEKEQIIDANRDGVDMCIQNLPFITGEQYYNEAFKSE